MLYPFVVLVVALAVIVLHDPVELLLLLPLLHWAAAAAAAVTSVIMPAFEHALVLETSSAWFEQTCSTVFHKSYEMQQQQNCPQQQHICHYI
jgi:hypothetical protein